MHCTKCGREVPNDALFCPSCGAKMELQETSEEKENVKKVEPVDPLKAAQPVQTQNNKKPNGSNKKRIAIIAGVLIVIALVVVLIVVLAGTRNQNKMKDSSSSTTAYQTESTTAASDEDFAVKGDHLDMPEEDRGLYTGVGRAVIKSVSSKPKLYYFNCGTFDKTYTGFADSLALDQGMPRYRYYVKNGIVQTNFTGFISRANYLRYVKNGVEQDDFNGTFYLDEFDDEGNAIKDGALYGFEMGRPDNWIFPLHKWHVEAD